jgi:hypothetical protein
MGQFIDILMYSHFFGGVGSVVAEELATRADLVAVSAQDPGDRAAEAGWDQESQLHAIV